MTDHIKREHVLLMMVAIDNERATDVQRRWRARQANRRQMVELRSALVLQAAARGRFARQEYPERRLRQLMMANAARTIQRATRKRFARTLLKKQCRGFVEKRSTKWRLGPIEMSVWQLSYVFATNFDFRYQKAKVCGRAGRDSARPPTRSSHPTGSAAHPVSSPMRPIASPIAG